VDLDAIEAGFLGEAGAPDVLRHDTGNLFDVQGTRDDVVSHLLTRPELTLRLDGGRGDGEFTVRLVVRVRDAADVPELQEDAAALGVHGGGDLLPTRDLLVRVDARGVRVTMAAGRDCGGLGDDQAGAGALGVVFGHQVRRDVGTFGPATGQRGHQDAVRERERTDLKRREERGHWREDRGREGKRTGGKEAVVLADCGKRLADGKRQRGNFQVTGDGHQGTATGRGATAWRPFAA
jgi:hypothetical protein